MNGLKVLSDVTMLDIGSQGYHSTATYFIFGNNNREVHLGNATFMR